MRTVRQSSAVTEATRQMLAHQGTRPHKAPAQKENFIYFKIAMYDMDESGRPRNVKELRAGRRYTLVVTCEKDSSSIDKNLSQEKVSITGAFSLSLSYSYSVSTTISLPLPLERSFTGVFENEEEHELTIPADLPSGNWIISLGLILPSRKYPSEVAQYAIPVHGQQNAPILEILNISQINRHLPAKTAILLVETAAEQLHTLRLRGWAETGQQLEDVAVINVIVSVEELRQYRQRKQQQSLAPEGILNRLRHMSHNSSRKLLFWLNGLFKGEAFNLIIVDLTDKEIPWELLEFEEGLYLGACARVVRWLPVQYFLAQRILTIEPSCHEGPTLSYLAEELGLDLIRDEQLALQRLAGKSHASLLELKKRLADSLDDVGLIYIGCHGIEGRGLGALQQAVPELSSIMLEGIYRCHNPRLTVFINACEAARTIKKSRDDSSNFVETFLAYCASGFIGPLAQVDIQTASAIAKQVLLAALQQGGVQIAELLRTLRKSEIMQLEILKKHNAAEEKDYYRVLDTFMYVYYGNPLAYLQLRQREEAGQ